MRQLSDFPKFAYFAHRIWGRLEGRWGAYKWEMETEVTISGQWELRIRVQSRKGWQYGATKLYEATEPGADYLDALYQDRMADIMREFAAVIPT
jgi:hypothetical protein